MFQPYGRSKAREPKADPVQFRSRQYSLEGRRCGAKKACFLKDPAAALLVGFFIYKNLDKLQPVFIAVGCIIGAVNYYMLNSTWYY